MTVDIKDFEANQLDWWLAHYRAGRNDLALRLRDYLDGNLAKGILLATLEGTEKEMEERENLD